MKDDNKAFWERFAKLYSPIMERSSKQLYEQISARIAPQLSCQMDVLELACGSGQLSFRLASKARSWGATDFSAKMIAQAKRQNALRHLHFSVQDATRLPYADASFDAVLISNALHIMPHPEKALLEIHRVLKPDGILYAPTFIHGKGAGFRLRTKLFELAGFHVYHKWDQAAFSTFVRGFGFTVKKAECLGKNTALLCYLEATAGQT